MLKDIEDWKERKSCWTNFTFIMLFHLIFFLFLVLFNVFVVNLVIETIWGWYQPVLSTGVHISFNVMGTQFPYFFKLKINFHFVAKLYIPSETVSTRHIWSMFTIRFYRKYRKTINRLNRFKIYAEHAIFAMTLSKFVHEQAHVRLIISYIIIFF